MLNLPMSIAKVSILISRHESKVITTADQRLSMVSTLDNTIFDPESFARLLGLERKRTHRSQRPFLLMLLDLRRLLQGRQHQRSKLVKNVIKSLQLCSRQTDITGWYTRDTVIGIIYTEISDAATAVDKILERVHAALQGPLTLQQINAILISTYVYPPEDPESSEPPDNDRLYPDLKQHRLASLTKRLLDIVGSFMLLVLLLPVLVCIAMAIKLTSKGPILFKQKRIGQFGQQFMFLKFRSMYTDADSRVHQQYVQAFITQSKNGNGSHEALKQNGLFKLSQDPRITPVGHFIRTTSLDELPQLFNVLAGTMSLVGPRPPIPYEAEYYDIWHRRRVLEAKPGITGLWQVKAAVVLLSRTWCVSICNTSTTGLCGLTSSC
jgi:lipopolysaccharide/colanic/teichoic acid biosynthesis glycosyltransferase